MDYGNMLRDSYAYAKDGVVGNKNKWLMLIIATILLELPLMGYLMKVFRAEKPAPEVQGWGTLFIDGIKWLIVSIIYCIPLLIVYVLAIAVVGAAVFTGDSDAMMGAMAGVGLILGLIALVLYIITVLLLPIAAVRFARTGSIGAALQFKEILAQIKRIGWISYIIALIIGSLVIGIPVAIIWFILMAIMIGLAMIVAELSLLGMLLAAIVFLALMPLISVFMARYITQIYDSAG
jgi:hypothetical protein